MSQVRYNYNCSRSELIARSCVQQQFWESSPYGRGADLAPSKPDHLHWSETTNGAGQAWSSYGSPKPLIPHDYFDHTINNFPDSSMDNPDNSAMPHFPNYPVHISDIPGQPVTDIGSPKLVPKAMDHDGWDGPSPSVPSPGSRNGRGRNATTAGSYLPLDQRRKKTGGIGKRSKKPSQRNKGPEKSIIFHCTFRCGMRTKSASNWKRHEKSQHLLSSVWICALNGPADCKTGRCVYCCKEHKDAHQKLRHDTPFPTSILQDVASHDGQDASREPRDPFLPMESLPKPMVDQTFQGNGYAVPWTIGLRKGPQGIPKATIDSFPEDKRSSSTAIFTSEQRIDAELGFQEKYCGENIHNIPQFDGK
jgi:hypothetical protein